MKILVIGGTRYFGRRLVHKLVEDGHNLWVMSRGQVGHDFGSSVQRLVADRNDTKAFAKAVQGLFFDVVVDQVCMTADHVRISLQGLQGNFKKYILTSTLSVYDWGESLTEDLVVPEKYISHKPTSPMQEYAEGKRAAEHALVTGVGRAWAIARFPVVFGEDDYTRRLHGEVQRISEGQPLYYPNLAALFSFISSEDAALALRWLVSEDRTGTYNFASEEVMTLRALVELIEDVVGKSAHFAKEPSAEANSPFGVPQSWTLSVRKAKADGFVATPVGTWLRPLLEHYRRQIKS